MISERETAFPTIKLSHLFTNFDLPQYCFELWLVDASHKPTVEVNKISSERRLKHLTHKVMEEEELSESVREHTCW